MRYAIFLYFLLLLNTALAEPVVIVNNSNAVSSLKANQISNIFLKKQVSFNENLEAIPVNLSEGQPIRNEFYEKITQKNDAQLKAYWAKIIFTGKNVPPDEFATYKEIKNFVASTPGGIGYIDKAQVDSTVKVLMIVQ